MSMERIALITGASSGIGTELAREMGRRGYHLILTGRNATRLKALCDEFDGHAEWLSLDLSKPEEINALADLIREQKPDVLINNAGFGIFGDFMDANPSDTQALVNVNCLAVTTLMQAAMKAMQGKENAFILNVASVAGLLPSGPHLCSYYASKSYVVSLTLGARQEARERGLGISISALCPGPVNTRFNERAGVRFALPGKEPDAIAEAAIRGMFQGRALIVPGGMIRASAVLARLLPETVYTALISRQQRKKG